MKRKFIGLAFISQSGVNNPDPAHFEVFFFFLPIERPPFGFFFFDGGGNLGFSASRFARPRAPDPRLCERIIFIEHSWGRFPGWSGPCLFFPRRLSPPRSPRAQPVCGIDFLAPGALLGPRFWVGKVSGDGFCFLSPLGVGWAWAACFSVFFFFPDVAVGFPPRQPIFGGKRYPPTVAGR